MNLDSYTKSLLHFTGNDGATAIRDMTGKVWSASGNAQLDTAQYKFAPSSLLLDGTGDYVGTIHNDDFNLGAGNFTIDLYFKRNANDTLQSLVNKNYSYHVFFDVDNKLYTLVYYASGSFNAGISASAIVDTSWHHMAWVRNGSNWYLFLDGTLSGSATNGATVTSNTNSLLVGALNSTQFHFNGWIDEFRLSVGIARWTSSFTPPARQYGNEFIPRTIVIGE
jgi:hypothetical protein